MRGKFLFIVGLAIGYVFGTRAGRKRYEQIKSAAQNIWESEPVQWSVKQAQDAVGDVAEEAITAAAIAKLEYFAATVTRVTDPTKKLASGYKKAGVVLADFGEVDLPEAIDTERVAEVGISS